MKLFKKLWLEISNHNFCKSVAVIFCVALLLWCYGCPVKCNSILHPGTKISGVQLQQEVDFFFAQAATEANSIAKQDELREWFFNQSLNVVSTGVFSWYQLLTGFGTLIGLGAFGDNIRYRLKFPQSSKPS